LLVGVVAIELGSALSLVLVQSVSGVQPAREIASVVELNAEDRVPVQPAAPQTASPPALDSKKPATKPDIASKRARATRSATRRLRQQAKVSKVEAENKVVDMLRAKGGRLEDASARGVARLIGGKKSTVHSALAGLIAAGVVVKAGGALMLAGA